MLSRHLFDSPDKEIGTGNKITYISEREKKQEKTSLQVDLKTCVYANNKMHGKTLVLKKW
jgi:hypothetical protein